LERGGLLSPGDTFRFALDDFLAFRKLRTFWSDYHVEGEAMKVFLVPLLASLMVATFIGRIRAAGGGLHAKNRFMEIRGDADTRCISIIVKGKTVLSGTLIGGDDLPFKFGASKVSSGIGLADDLPFAVVTTSFRNDDKQPIIINRFPVFQGKAEFSGKSSSLKILGSGGLTKPGKRIGSYMWLTAADPETRNGIVAGFLTTERGSGVVFAEEKDQQLQIDAQLEHGRLTVKPDETVVLDTFVIGYFDDVRVGMEAWADAVAAKLHIKLPPQPCGYCTWYHAGSSNEKALVKQTEIAAKELAPFGFNFLQIDDGWQDGVSHNGPRKNFTRARPDGPYPSGMQKTADMIRAHGLTPGIWFMPFAGTYDDPWFKSHQDWFAKCADGKPFDTGWGGTCIDMTNSEARKYLHDWVHQISHDWGYRFFKMDGLSTGAAVRPQYVNLAYKDDHFGESVLHDKDKTHIEAFRSGLRLVREAAGPEVFLLGCCAPQNMRSYGGAFGLVDAMRVGPDNGGGSWKAILTGPRIASRHYHLNGRIWYNDPDVVYVRDSLTLDQARANASWVAITGQLFIVSDDFSKLKPERLEVLKRVMPAHGQHFRPVDLLEEEIPRIWLVTSGTGKDRRDVVALFNWDEKPCEVDYPLDRIGLPQAKRYIAFDFWGNRLLPPIEARLNVKLPPSSCMILSVLPEADHPQVIGTSRHVTQGMIDLVEQKWDATKKTLSGRIKVVARDTNEIRIAHGQSWRAAKVFPWAGSREKTVEADVPKVLDVDTPNVIAGGMKLIREQDLTRVRISQSASGVAEWSVEFKD
jgi:hypothetical protein